MKESFHFDERGNFSGGGRGLGTIPNERLGNGAGGPGPLMEQGPETFGHGEDRLADGRVGKDVVHQACRGLGPAPDFGCPEASRDERGGRWVRVTAH